MNIDFSWFSDTVLVPLLAEGRVKLKDCESPIYRETGDRQVCRHQRRLTTIQPIRARFPKELRVDLRMVCVVFKSLK